MQEWENVGSIASTIMLIAVALTRFATASDSISQWWRGGKTDASV
jgi:hypothetical protein